MRIDCHCHVFSNDCIPMKALLQSRFGIVTGDVSLGKGSFASRTGRLSGGFSFDRDAIAGAVADPAEKDSLRYVATHPADFFRFTLAAMKGTPEIAAEMMQKAPGIDIWVPLMMDMRSGYVGDAPLTAFEDQKQIMMDLTAQARGRIMPFFAYDPRSGTIESVRNAIEKEGFVGVKLYPPLGFKPCGNSDLHVESRLDDLYAYCSTGNTAPIPITAHCSWSDGIYSNRRLPGVRRHKDYYRGLADPAHWEKVLTRYPGLKINLAHFGGAGEWERISASAAPPANGRSWSKTIGRLMRTYEHVYTDLSFHGILARKDGDAYRRALNGAVRGVEDRILLGSDWYMSALQCDLTDYWRSFAAVFPDRFADMTGPNAVRFLQSPAAEAFFPAFLSGRNGMDSKFANVFQQTQGRNHHAN